MLSIRKYILWILLTLLSIPAIGQLNTTRILSIGRNALYFEDYVLSIQYFNQVIRIKPYLTEPYYYRAIAKIQLEDFEGAEQDINEVLVRNPFLAGAYYARGFARKQIGKYAEAEEDFNKALEFSPDNLPVLLNRVENYEHQEKWDNALEDIDLLIRQHGEMQMLGFERGRVLFLKGDTLGSLSTFNKMIEKDSTTDEGWALRGLIYLQMGKYKEALGDYNHAIKYNKYNATYYINRGILNYYAKNYRGALADYDNAIKLEPHSKLSLFNRALLRDEVGDYDRAEEDLTAVLAIDPNYYEAYLKRAEIYIKKCDWKNAEHDYTTIILRYPNFPPAYYGRSTARQHLGMVQSAYLDQEAALRLEKNKDKIKKDLSTNAKYAEDESVRDHTSEFDASGGAELTKSKYGNSIRGDVQNRFADVTLEKNFVISYYTMNEVQNYFVFIAELNKSGIYPGTLKITNKEIALTSPSIDLHNQSINNFSHLIQDNPQNAYLYFARALDYALTQDINSSIEDYTHAINADSKFALAYFCRANMRYKQMEYLLSEIEENIEGANNITKSNVDKLTNEKKYSYDFELIMRDYDKTIELQPEFEYAWFNRANILCAQKDFKSAIQNYTRAILINANFGEAYFNRGLTRIYLGDTKEGLQDLSKAGELGIYQAYNILKRLK